MAFCLEWDFVSTCPFQQITQLFEQSQPTEWATPIRVHPTPVGMGRVNVTMRTHAVEDSGKEEYSARWSANWCSHYGNQCDLVLFV